MENHMYALSRSERGWLVYSTAFLVTAIIYGSLAQFVVSTLSHPESGMVLRDCPVLLLISLSAGFLFTTVGHYAIRQALIRDNRRVIAHD